MIRKAAELTKKRSPNDSAPDKRRSRIENRSDLLLSTLLNTSPQPAPTTPHLVTSRQEFDLDSQPRTQENNHSS